MLPFYNYPIYQNIKRQIHITFPNKESISTQLLHLQVQTTKHHIPSFKLIKKIKQTSSMIYPKLFCDDLL